MARSGEVLDLVRRGRATTTSELAEIMGVARSTVTERVDLLVSHGLLVPASIMPARRGRPPTVLTFNARAGLTLAAQLGMSGTRVAVTDFDGTVLWSETVVLDIGHGPDVVLERITSEFGRALAELGQPRDRVHGVGIGLPGKVELATAQRTATGSARSWIDYPVAERLEAAGLGPVFVDQDVNLLALGEHRASWPSVGVFMFLKVGSVIGCGIVIDGKVVRGVAGLAGEIGHTRAPGRDTECACGGRGCLNAVAGGTALARDLAQAGFDAATARDVVRLAQDGVVEAGQAIRAAGRDIGDVLAAAINLLNPGVISVWGYLADAGDQLFAGIQEQIYSSAVHGATHLLRLEPSRLGDDAGIRGAAMTVVEHALLPEAVDRYLLQAHEA
ncbi:ROK family transcriptional regulator [Jiangella asiatica]|uniref:ROK family transcriptional regulator n=1 Tax=Jiangella asiatica TaxID=2530372 RepID=A0A4R5D9F4_9ACTN|nr:ROK family transcriptional regulator [Jiangella asiatica]